MIETITRDALSPVELEEIEACASRGAEFLDSEEPSWANKIKPLTLYMRDCGLCVLGQLYHQYGVGVELLDLDEDEEHFLGFDLPVSYYSDKPEETPKHHNAAWVALGTAWKEEIGLRVGEVGQTRV